MSVTQAAACLGITRQRVLQLIAAGRLPAQRVGSTWVILASDVEAHKRLKPWSQAPRKSKGEPT